MTKITMITLRVDPYTYILHTYEDVIVAAAATKNLMLIHI
jgi:hypothetical protein